MAAEAFFSKVLEEFNLDSFKARSSMDMLVMIKTNWMEYLIQSGEFGFVSDQMGNQYFVCTTSKSGIAIKGDLTDDEKKRIFAFEKAFKAFFELTMDEQGEILKQYFPE